MPPRPLRTILPSVVLLAAAGVIGGMAQAACTSTVYLGISTGSMSQAERIADILKRHQVRATFFVANEKTVNGDGSLDPGWAGYWRARVAEGHLFGNHTFDHVGFPFGDEGDTSVGVPTQGPRKGSRIRFDQTSFCAELDRVKTRFRELTGHDISPIWHSPGGRLSPNALHWARACGYKHVGSTSAGILGDELPSDRYPNELLLKRALKRIGDGDILAMHTGIWSRKEPFAPMLDPLIAGLKQRGLCFATLDRRP